MNYDLNNTSGRGRKIDEFHSNNNITDGQLTEKNVRAIVQDEVMKNYRSGSPLIPPHRHNDVDNLRIKQSDIVNSAAIMGKILFTANDTYTLYFTSENPSRLDLNGFVFDTGANDSSIMVIGMAILSKSWYFQPLSTRSAKQGGIPYPINGVLAQCSSNLFVQDNAAVTFPHTEQFYIINAFSAAGTVKGTMQVQNLTDTSIDLVITNLASGWNISANFIIT